MSDWIDANVVADEMLYKWLMAKKGHRKARWKKKFSRMAKRITVYTSGCV
jgi:hypothetical protein